MNIFEYFKDDLFLEIWRACVTWRCLSDIISRSSIIHLFKPSKSCPFQTIVCKSAAQQKNNSINSWWIKTSNLNCRMQMSSQLFTWTVKNNKSWNTGWYRASNHCFEYLTNLELCWIVKVSSLLHDVYKF